MHRPGGRECNFFAKTAFLHLAFRGLPGPVPRVLVGGGSAPEPSEIYGASPAPNPGFTFSHLNALRAAMRIEAYGLYAQK